MAERWSQESSEDELRDSSSLTFREEETTSLSQKQRAPSSTSSKPIGSSGPSRRPLANLGYPPFFRTDEQLRNEGSSMQPEVGSDQRGAESTTEVPSWEDSEPPEGLLPYYRSKEETFPSLPYLASPDPPTRREWHTGCFHKTVVSRSSVAASADLDLVSECSPICCTILLVSSGHSHDSLDTTLSSDAAASSGPTLRDSGFVPYYRTSEEKLHTSPEPSASLRAAKSAQGRGPGPVQPHSKDPKPKPAAARAWPSAPSDR